MPRRSSSLDRYLGRGEQILVESRQHPFAIVAGFIEAVLWLIPLSMVLWGMYGLTWIGQQVQDAIFYTIFSAMILVLVRLAWSVLGWELARVVVTSEKVIHVHGILHRQISSTPLVKVSELTVSQPPFGRIFGYGSLLVDAPGGGRPLHGLAYIPDPSAIYRTINEISRRERAFEGGADLSESHASWLDTGDSSAYTPPSSASMNTGSGAVVDSGGPITSREDFPGSNDVTNVIRGNFAADSDPNADKPDAE